MASLKLYLRLTDVCNLSCRMCGQARRRGAEPAADVLLDEARVRAFVQRLPQRVSFAYLWGGEPLLHPGCESIVEIVKDQGALVELNTNGMQLEWRAASLVTSGVDRIIVSIDGPGSIHDRIRGAAGAFERVARGVAALRSERQRQRERLAISANVTISDDNAAQLVETVDACQRIGVDAVAIRLPIWVTPEALASYESLLAAHGVRGSRACRGFVDVGYGGPLAPLGEQLEALRARGDPRIDIPGWYFDQRLLARYCGPASGPLWQGGRCSEASRHLNVEPDGTIVMCSDFPDLVIGTLDDPPSSTAAADTRRALLASRPTPCDRCCSFIPTL